MKEIWRKIKSYPDYQVSNLGRVKSFKTSTPRILKGCICKGYNLVVLCEEGRCKTFRVHRLVGLYFVKGKTKYRNEINHIDGNTNNNFSVNLEWVTAKENSRHRTEVLNKRNSNLTAKQVIRIRSLYPKLTMQEIADQFGIWKGSVHRILRRDTWQHI